MRYSVTKEIKSETKVTRAIFLKDFFFLLGYLVTAVILQNLLHNKVIILYWIFNCVMAVILVLPSRMNKKRRVWQAALLLLRKTGSMYYPVINLSKKPKPECIHGRRKEGEDLVWK